MKQRSWGTAKAIFLLCVLSTKTSFGDTLSAPGLTDNEPSAAATPCYITGTVSGETVQKVGFRASLLELAITYQLGGWAENNSDGSVSFSYGDLTGKKCDRLNEVIAAIPTVDCKAEGATVENMNSSSMSKVNYNLFTVKDWTSTSRCFFEPNVDLVYQVGQHTNKADIINQYKPANGWACNNQIKCHD